MITDRPDGNTYYNYTDLNRVEAKAEELAALMTAEGYIVTVSVKRTGRRRIFRRPPR